MSVFGEIISMTGFHEQDNLQLEYTIQNPDGWFHRHHQHDHFSRVSHMCRVNEDSVAHTCLPFSMDFLVSDDHVCDKKQEPAAGNTSDQKPDTNDQPNDSNPCDRSGGSGISWPRICVRVYKMDSFGRRFVSGIGSAVMPQAAGQHMLTISTCRTVSYNHLDQLSEHFLGYTDQDDDADDNERDVTHVYPQMTVTSGSVTIRMNVILRSEASIQQRKRDRQLLSASIEEVVAAFERAKLEMMEVRHRVIRQQQKDQKVSIQRTFL
jgi:hypothetical protein